jgi:glucosamine kinase
MLLLADSGSTKTDWALIDESKAVTYYRSKGFNPYFHDTDFIVNELQQHPDLQALVKSNLSIRFYGSGAGSEALQARMKDSLGVFFKTRDIQVAHDLEGAALSTYRGVAQVSCILGTGSNACFHSAERLYQEVPSLGYVLGDEGSASYFGRLLLRDYFYKRMPKAIAGKFESSYNLDKDKVIFRLYREAGPNVFLAEHARFLADIETEDYAQSMLRKGFRSFIELSVLSIKESREVEVNFVGSIAYHYHKLLSEACLAQGLKFGHVVQSPIKGLVRYYLSEGVD